MDALNAMGEGTWSIRPAPPSPRALSADQERAARAIFRAIRAGLRVLVLAGAAGTGKTTLIRELVARLRCDGWRIQLAAPTGKAASRLSEVTGEPARTVHSLAYGTVVENERGEPVFLDPRRPCEEDTVLIIDEASMVGSRMSAVIEANLPPRCVVLYVGDREQLRPVGDTWGPDFDHPTAVLEVVHRQALDSPILRIATELRERGTPVPVGRVGDAYLRCTMSMREAVSWYARRTAPNTVALTWMNTSVATINRRVRRARVLDGVVARGDRLRITQNNRHMGLMNGEVFTVADLQVRTVESLLEPERRKWIEPEVLRREVIEVRFANAAGEPGRPVLVDPGTFGERWSVVRESVRGTRIIPDQRFIAAKHGWAITAHCAQGSEYDEGLIAIDGDMRQVARGFGLDSEERSERHRDSRRWMYTALTRFSDKVLVADVVS